MRGVDAAAQAFLVAVAESGRACGAAFRVHCEENRVEIEPEADAGFSVHVQAEDDAVVVSLGPWIHRFEREEDPEDDQDVLASAHDLVAAGLWGRARVRIELLDERPWRTTVCFGAPGRWLTFERVGGGLRAPWRKPRLETRINEGRPPRGVKQKARRPLPGAPWAGVRGDTGPAMPPQPIAVDGELDLHPFSPKEVKPLVLEYIEACRAKGIHELRIVHGKGIGNLRRTVHALLERHPAVADFRLGGHGAGSWGATLVDLHPLDSSETSP